jgi:uncharacterized membrane protein
VPLCYLQDIGQCNWLTFTAITYIHLKSYGPFLGRWLK